MDTLADPHAHLYKPTPFKHLLHTDNPKNGIKINTFRTPISKSKSIMMEFRSFATPCRRWNYVILSAGSFLMTNGSRRSRRRRRQVGKLIGRYPILVMILRM
ncbi:hypothetical protein R6Q57_003721 [Mikania cordata]